MLLGVAAGLLSGVPTLLLAYFAGVFVIAISTRDLPATLLAAVTVLPLILIFVGIPLSLVVGSMYGLLLGLGSMLRSRQPGILVGAALGVLCSLLILGLLIPLLAASDSGFLQIVSRPYVAAIYGAVLGAIGSRIFRWLES